MFNESETQAKTKKIIVGLCFMQRKLKNKRYQQIFKLLNCEEIQTIQLYPYFDKHWTAWPVVNVLFQCHTSQFPYIMVYEYVQKHKPLLINNIQNEQLLWDRTVTYGVLNQLGIPIPKYWPILMHDNHVQMLQKDCYGKIFKQNGQIIDFEEYKKTIDKNPSTLFRTFYEREKQKFNCERVNEQVDGIRIKSDSKEIFIQKPFVQKPCDSSNHKVILYYQQKLGGGQRILYRQKKQGLSGTAESQYRKNAQFIRKDQDYIYEEYIGNNLFDIKVHTMGDFAFAQSRRSPTVDVQKDVEGRQIRCVIELTPEEKEYCRRIVKGFDLPVCGIDFLRSNGKSYVCDINGWGFARGGESSQAQGKIYWPLMANLLKNKIFEKFSPEKVQQIDCQSHYKQLFKISHQRQNLINKSETQEPANNELRNVVIILGMNKQVQNMTVEDFHNLMSEFGENIRQTSYGNVDCLKLYYTFKHILKSELLCEQIDQITAGHFLRGFLGLNGELSPPIVSMVKKQQMNERLCKDDQFSKSKITQIMTQLVQNLKAQQNSQNNSNNLAKLQTNILFVNEKTFQMLQQKIKMSDLLQLGINDQDKQKQSSREEMKKLPNTITIKMFKNKIQQHHQEQKENTDYTFTLSIVKGIKPKYQHVLDKCEINLSKLQKIFSQQQ